MSDNELIADAIAAENVRLWLNNVLSGAPLAGTLADRVDREASGVGNG